MFECGGARVGGAAIYRRESTTVGKRVYIEISDFIAGGTAFDGQFLAVWLCAACGGKNADDAAFYAFQSGQEMGFTQGRIGRVAWAGE